MDIMDAMGDDERQYKMDCPSDYQIRQLIDAAVWAPSTVVGPSWHFTVITGPDLLHRISTKAKSWILQNEPWVAESDGLRARLNSPDYHMLHHAPVLVVIAIPSKDKWSAEICAAAAQNFMQAASAHGLGSCWVGVAQDWLNSPDGKATVGLPDEMRFIASIAVGFSAESRAAVRRRRPAITWIGDDSRIVEDGEAAKPVPTHGLFGGLVAQLP